MHRRDLQLSKSIVVIVLSVQNLNIYCFCDNDQVVKLILYTSFVFQIY